MTTIRQELTNRYNKLNNKLAEEIRGRVCLTPKASRIIDEMKEIQAEIKRLDYQVREMDGLHKIPKEKSCEILMIPLLADLLNDTVASVNQTLREAGLARTGVSNILYEIQKLALVLVDAMDQPEAQHLLDEDDSLIDEVKEIMKKYILARLKD